MRDECDQDTRNVPLRLVGARPGRLKVASDLKDEQWSIS